MDQNFNNQPNEEQTPTTPTAPQENTTESEQTTGTPPQQDNGTYAQQFTYTQPNGTSYNYYQNQPPKSESNGYAIASLILGIVSLVLCCCSCISIVTAILAIVFAVLSRQGQPMRGNAIGGLICGIIGLLTALLCTGFFLLNIGETNYEDLDDFFNNYMEDGYGVEGENDYGFNGDYTFE